MTTSLQGVGRRLADGIAGLSPGYFALVMATGIVSIACDMLAMHGLAEGLLVINVVAYGVLVPLLAARVIFFPKRVLDDVQNHARGPGFFTVVAGTCVLGTQLLVVAERHGLARAAWYAGIGLWVLAMYTFFTATITRTQKPSLEAGVNGAWLLGVVATQSVSVLGSLLAPEMTEATQSIALFFTLCMYLLGAMLYLAIITLIFYRIVFLPLDAQGITPPYWINMGAVAITTLAGSILVLRTGSWTLLAELRPFLLGFTLLFWSAATWWIPLLLILGAWRHIVRRYPVRYDPQYWGLVFPLGMYTASTLRLSHAAGLDFLLIVPETFIWVALTAWLGVFTMMLHSLYRGVFERPLPALID